MSSEADFSYALNIYSPNIHLAFPVTMSMSQLTQFVWLVATLKAIILNAKIDYLDKLVRKKTHPKHKKGERLFVIVFLKMGFNQLP